MLKRVIIVVACIMLFTVTAMAEAPVIAVQPHDVLLPESALTEGANINFTVVATGENLSYQWQSFNNGGNGIWQNVSNQTGTLASFNVNASAAIVRAYINNNVKFKCIITSSDGQSVETDSVTTNVVGVYILGSIRQLLDYIGQTVESILLSVGSVSDVIVTSPMLAIGLAFFFFGGVIAIVGRLLSRN